MSNIIMKKTEWLPTKYPSAPIKGIEWASSSCWLDTAFLALFHTPTEIITSEVLEKNFVPQEKLFFGYKNCDKNDQLPGESF